jgi:hypothetical protein
MTGETTRAPRKRRRAALLAVLFLLVGLGLLLFSAAYVFDRSSPGDNAAAPPRLTTSPSPVLVEPVPSDSTSGTPVPPSPTISYTPVPTYIPVYVPAEESGLLPLITTVSGLLASLAGIVSAVVSVKSARR